ncbi:hypothetical protein [Georgenia sp. Z1491]|uniref:hypothetical protein n=1 Tax=Georgenia sp. Z1491 TaxID=3416707 RepID=UPI003CEC2FE9
MSATRRDRALLALVTAGVLGAAASAGTLALWTASASGEGSIGAERFSDPARGLAESATDGPDEAPSQGPAESPTDGPSESSTDGPAESASAGSTESPSGGSPASATAGHGPNAPGGPTQDEPAPGETSPEAPAPEEPPAPVRIDLPAELVYQINAHGRGASLIQHGLTEDELATFDVSLMTDVPDLAWRMQVYTVTAPEQCSVTDVDLPVDDGTPVELELDTSTLLCLELEAATTDRSGSVSASGTSEAGDVSAQEDWAVTVHDTLTADDIEVVLTPVIEVTP